MEMEENEINSAAEASPGRGGFVAKRAHDLSTLHCHHQCGPQLNCRESGDTISGEGRQTGSVRKRRSQGKDLETNDVQLSKSLSWVLRHSAPSLGLRPTPDGYIPVEDVLSLKHPRFQKNRKSPSHLGSTGANSGHAPLNQKYTIGDVIRVVENSDKQRFRLEYKRFNDRKVINHQTFEKCNTQDSIFDGVDTSTHTNQQQGNITLCIRANQGHSFNNIIDSDKLLTPLSREELIDPSLNIIHGTTRRAWEDHIRIEGLRRMKRNHIHFATHLPNSSTLKCSNDIHNRVDECGKPLISGIRASSQIYIYVNGEKCAKEGIKFYRSENGVILTAGESDEGILPVKYFKVVVKASSGKVLFENDN